MFNLINDSYQDHALLKELLEDFFPFAQRKLGFNKPVSIKTISDQENAAKPLGQTGFYDPDQFTIGVYTDNRHIKDILRSIAHELVHHAQNCNDKFINNNSTEEGYAQSNPHLRKMEGEAYIKGNMVFRDWTDMLSTDHKMLMENKQKQQLLTNKPKKKEPMLPQEEPNSDKEWYHGELFKKLRKKWSKENK